MNIESRLAELIGPAAGRLHTARSRNDQVATDFRLWVRDPIDHIDALLGDYQRRWSTRRRARRTVMPGFTHLQSAQPVTFGHHLLAYVEMVARDRGRFADAAARLNESRLARRRSPAPRFRSTARGRRRRSSFDRPMANSLDAVSDRDFVLETLAAAAIASVHLSRFAEEIVMWTSPLVGLMQALRQVHHRLLDHAAEAQSGRRRAGARQDRPHGRRAHRDAGRDEGPAARLSEGHAGGQGGTFDALDALALSIDAMTGMVRDMEPDTERMKAAAGAGYATATDLADWLVRMLKMPFREAHHVTGRIVAKAAEARCRCTSCRSPRCRRSSRGSRRRCSTCCRSSARCEPHQLRRHRAEERPRAGEEMAEEAGARAQLSGVRCVNAITVVRPRKCHGDLLWCRAISQPALLGAKSVIDSVAMVGSLVLALACLPAAGAKGRSIRRPAATRSSERPGTTVTHRGEHRRRRDEATGLRRGRQADRSRGPKTAPPDRLADRLSAPCTTSPIATACCTPRR